MRALELYTLWQKNVSPCTAGATDTDVSFHVVFRIGLR